MYKIYINNTPVYLTTRHGNAIPDSNEASSDIFITDHTSQKTILDTLDTINNAKGLRACYLLSRNPKLVLNNIIRFYKLIEAAGGIVLNSNDEILLIFRRGKWDLPKGKLNSGETKRRGAIREVKEETGIKKLRVIQSLKLYQGKQSCTYHSYVENGESCIKASYWFLMHTPDTGKLVPQLEEDIVQAVWVHRSQLPEYLDHTFGSVRDIIEVALQAQ
ncbi:hypothetical protein LBMAG25_15040 [Bacteroidota bacterium]|nr:hypothetical protein LBMAG25_15040 [Bacteroidota bacterium]